MSVGDGAGSAAGPAHGPSSGAGWPDPEAGTPAGLHTQSLRRRVTAGTLVVLAVLIAALGAFVDLTLERRLRADLRAQLVDATANTGSLAGGSARTLAREVAQQGWGVRVHWPDGTVVTVGPPPATPLPPLDPAQTGQPGVLRREGMAGMMGGSGVVVTDLRDAMVATRWLPGGGTLEVVATTDYVDRAVAQTRLLTAVGGAGVLLLGWWALGRTVGAALAPLDTMTSVARSITRGNRGRRLHPDRTDTELGRTAAAFDEMLDALEGAEGAARRAEVQARSAEAAARAAETRMRDFLSDAAHELRTPVAGLRSVAETSLRTELPVDDRERLAVVMVQEAARAGRLVDDLLAMARIDRGLDLHRQPVDVAGLVAAQADRLRLVSPDLTVRVSGSSCPASADPERLTQVLANLLDNARRAVGGRGRVDVSLADDDGWVIVDVRDDGPGIPDDARERIFDRFVRLDESRSGTGGGTGLGLPIARGIARAHGGDLQALPCRGGAWLQLRLPAAADAGPAQRHA